MSISLCIATCQHCAFRSTSLPFHDAVVPIVSNDHRVLFIYEETVWVVELVCPIPVSVSSSDSKTVLCPSSRGCNARFWQCTELFSRLTTERAGNLNLREIFVRVLTLLQQKIKWLQVLQNVWASLYLVSGCDGERESEAVATTRSSLIYKQLNASCLNCACQCRIKCTYRLQKWERWIDFF